MESIKREQRISNEICQKNKQDLIGLLGDKTKTLEINFKSYLDKNLKEFKTTLINMQQ